MNTTDKVLFLLESNKISFYELAKILGLSQQSMTKWKQGISKPSADAIAKIAAHFNVTTDYLIYDDLDEPTSTRLNRDGLPKSEIDLIYSRLSKKSKELIMSQALALVDLEEKL